MGTEPRAEDGDLPREVHEIGREIAIGGVAGLVAGLLVVGVGGRLFMRIAAVIDPSAIGVFTSNGNRIGEITLGGTMAFVIFAGPMFGAMAAVIWVTVAPWLPARGMVRAAANGVVAATVASFFLVRADERDFRLIVPILPVVAMAVALVAILGVVVALVDDRLRRRLPSGSVGSRSNRAYWAVALIGVLFVPLVVGGYFGTTSSTFRPPWEVGLAMLVVGLATVRWWLIRARDGLQSPPASLMALGRGGLVVAMILGTMKLASEASAVLSVASP